MSKVELPKIIEMLGGRLRPPEPNAPREAWDNYNRIVDMAQRIDSLFSRMSDVVSKELTLGMPDDGTVMDMVNAATFPFGTGIPSGKLDNVEGQWVTAVLDNPNQLGNGAGAPVVFTHGLNVPVVGVAGGAPNVRWLGPNVSFGFKGLAAAAAAANPAHTTVHYSAGDAVTPDSIELRIHSNLVIGVLAPLYVELFFMRAVV